MLVAGYGKLNPLGRDGARVGRGKPRPRPADVDSPPCWDIRFGGGRRGRLHFGPLKFRHAVLFPCLNPLFRQGNLWTRPGRDLILFLFFFLFFFF